MVSTGPHTARHRMHVRAILPAEIDSLNALSRIPWQLALARQVDARPSWSLYCCCAVTLAHVKTAMAAPPDAPARRVVSVMIPRCFKTAAAHRSQQSCQQQQQQHIQAVIMPAEATRSKQLAKFP
jgi:hypothetical protein